MTSCTFNLKGYTLTISTGAAIFNGGTINNGALSLRGSSADYAGTTFNTTFNPKPIIFINGYFEVNENITFNDCIIRFGEQAEVHVLKGQTLRFTGCDVKSCNGYTWRSIYADEGATVIVEDNSETPTEIADADTALNLNNDADYNVIKSTFTNNYVGMYLYSYKRAVVSGRVVFSILHPSTSLGGSSSGYYTQDVDVSGLSNGFYLISLVTEKEKLNAKFVKE